jgi:hypothetical protein
MMMVIVGMIVAWLGYLFVGTAGLIVGGALGAWAAFTLSSWMLDKKDGER